MALYTVEKRGSVTVLQFESAGDFTRQSQLPCVARVNDSRHGVKSWTGTETFEEAINLFTYGWPEGRAKMMRAMSEAASTPSMSPSFMMDVAGAYPVAALAAAGDPCAMVDFSPVEDRVRPIVRLLICCVASAAYKVDEYMNYGAAVMSYVEGLEASNFRVEIMVSYCCMQPKRGALDTRFILKRAEEPFEMDKLAFVLAHPAMFRRICFGAWETAPEIAEVLDHSYGMPRNIQEGEADANQIIVPGVNMVRPGSAQLKTPKAALEHVAPMLEKQLQNAGMSPPPFAFAAQNGKA